MFWAYVKALLWNWRGAVLAVFGIVGLAERFYDKKFELSRNIKVVILTGAFIFANYFAYGDARLNTHSTEAVLGMFNDVTHKVDAGALFSREDSSEAYRIRRSLD